MIEFLICFGIALLIILIAYMFARVYLIIYDSDYYDTIRSVLAVALTLTLLVYLIRIGIKNKEAQLQGGQVYSGEELLGDEK